MKCSFCREDIKPGTGLVYVKKDGSIFYFCSKKCEKNQIKLKRNPVKVKWVRKEEIVKREKVAKEEKTRERKTKDKSKARKRRTRKKVIKK